MKILMIEDELFLALATQASLVKSNYAVDLAKDGEEGLDLARTGIYDLIILDIMLPKIDGLTILKTLRDEGINAPVILLTAKSEIEDKVKGLDLGADDYLAKPFHYDELLARLRALSRRPEILNDLISTYGDITLNNDKLNLKSGQLKTNLTLKEARILQLLINNSQRILTKDWIIEKAWDWESDAIGSHVESQISLIRKKLKMVNSAVKIKSIRGVGYILEEGN